MWHMNVKLGRTSSDMKFFADLFIIFVAVQKQKLYSISYYDNYNNHSEVYKQKQDTGCQFRDLQFSANTLWLWKWVKGVRQKYTSSLTFENSSAALTCSSADCVNMTHKLRQIISRNSWTIEDNK